MRFPRSNLHCKPKMRFRTLLVISILAFLGVSCARLPSLSPTPTTAAPSIIIVEENPFRPRSSDAGLNLGGAIISNTHLVERFDLDPFRVELLISGSLPSVCNELRIQVSPPNGNYQIFVEVYSLINKEIDCDNVFQHIEANILLGVYSDGRYTVWVNEIFSGDFTTY